MNYYNLIAGLPDLQQDDAKGIPSLLDFKNELLDLLSKSDSRLMLLLFSRYDNQNLLAFQKNKEAELDPKGNLTAEDWTQLFDLIAEGEKFSDSRLLSYVKTFLDTDLEELSHTKGIAPEDHLAALYFEYAMKSGNKFLNNWFEFNLNVNNILTAVICRKHGFDQLKMVIGHNEVAKALRHNHTRDFGLGLLFEDFEVVLRIAEEPNLLEREKKLDALKWSWLEENTFFEYFSIEKVLAYVLKIEMLERWKMLSFEEGALIFRDLLISLKKEVNIKA